MEKKRPTEIVPRGTAELVRSSRLARVPPALPHRSAVRPARTWLRELFALPTTESYLSAEERCVIRTHRHWLVPCRDIARAAGMMSIVGLLTVVAPGVFLLQLALWLGALAHTGYVGWCVLAWRAEQIAVTDRRIIRVSGILTTTVDAAPLSQITDATLRRSILGRILGYGALRFEIAGQKQGGLERMDFVPGVEAIYRATLQ